MTTDESGAAGAESTTTARFPEDDWDGLAALVAPILRARNETVGAEDDDFHDRGVVAMAGAGPLIDALYAAGVLVFTDVQDRAHLRKSWTAVSTALIHLSQDRPLSPGVLAAVPSSHRFYLLGHQAGHGQLREMYTQLLGSRLILEEMLRRGTTPTPAEIGGAIALMGGENPYAGGRPPIADPWWGCWTDAAADPASFEWEKYRRTCAPDAQIDGLGDLCAFLGGSWDAENPGATSLTGSILLLIVKAQNTPERFAAVQRAFPREVAAWRAWNAMSPSPTAGELYAELAGDLAVIDERPGAVLASVDDETLAAQIFDRAVELAEVLDGLPSTGAPAAVVNRDRLSPALRPLLPAGARAYALPWPAGTRALYDPVDGVTVRELGADATGMADVEVTSRTLFVPFGDGDRFPVGTVRRIEPHEKRRGRGRRCWECRHCTMGATGAVSAEAEKAECLGHEAICPDQDRMDLSIPRTAGRPRAAVSPGDPDWVEGFGPLPGASLGDLGEDR